MAIKKPTYEELEVEVNRLRKLQESNRQANDAKSLDVTEQNHAEQALRVSEARYRGLLQNIEAGIVVHAPDSSVIMNNSRAAELLGLSDDQMKGIAAIDPAWKFTSANKTTLLPEEYPVSLIATNKKSIKNKIFGIHHSGKNHIVWVIVNGFPVLNNKGEITEIVISFIDISERKKAEKSLRASKDALENLTNSLTDIVFSVKMPERIIEWCNNSIQTLEYEPDEIIGQTTAFLYTDEKNYLDFAIKLQQSLEEGQAVFITEQLFKKKNGELFSADVRVTCDLEDGEMVRATSVIRNITEQKKAVEDLKNEKKFLETVFDSITDGIVSCDANGVLNRFNQATKEFHGLPDIPIAANKWAEHYDIYFPDGKTPMQKKDVPLFRALTEGIVQNVEMMIIPKNGKRRLLVSNGKVLKDIDGKTLGAVVAMHDITEQREVQQELKESEEKYRALFENAPLSYQSLDEQGFFIDINPSWLRTLGYERNEVIGKNYADFLHPDWKIHFEKHFPAFKKRGYVNDVQYKIRHKKGHYIDISFEGCIGYLPDGSFKQTYCVFQDITERKKAEDKLKMFNRVIDHSLNAFDIVNHKGEFIYVNQAYADMWGYETAHEIIGLSPASHFADQNLADHIISEIKKNGEYISEIKAKRKDGSIFDALMYARLDYDENGNEIYPTTSLDISKRKLAEEKLKENEEKFRTFVNTASDLMCITNKDGQLTDVNKAMSEILDYSIEELKEMHISNLLTENALKNDFNPNWSKFIADGKVKIETTFKTKYGNEIPGELKAIAIYNKVGQFIGSRAVFIDLTQRKQVEEALRESEQRLNEAQRMASIGHWIEDMKSNKLMWSDETYRIFEVDKEFSGKLLDVYNTSIHPEDRVAVNNAYHKALKTKEPYDMSHRIKMPDGRVKHIHERCETEYDETGKPIKSIGTIQDITEKKKAEEELKKHKKNLEKLVVERTKELENKNKMLEKMNKVFIGRELRMKELKLEIKNLKEK